MSMFRGRMRIPTYVEPAISAIFLTSVTIHLITARQTHAQERARLTAQTTILGDLVGRVRMGELIPEGEFARLRALAARGRSTREEEEEQERRKIEAERDASGHVMKTTWKEVLLGRKPDERSSEELEEQARREWEEGTRHQTLSFLFNHAEL
ncbi:hypothetical protein DL93DRAFT_2088229 [Clavulina sp. PMI_390]|nr:hypothetical protein DL93DRAFT_2088229 [Clavulina sp. PMI_390]